MWIFSCLFSCYIISVSCYWVQYENSCYWISDVDKNFIEAERACQALNSDLVTIETIPEFDYINLQLQYHSTSNMYWVGIRTINPKDYRWKDNSEPQQIFWLDNEPNFTGDCVRLKKSTTNKYYLADHSCINLYRYICEKKIKDIFTTDVKKQSVLDQYECPFREFTVGSFLQCARSCYEDWECSTFGMKNGTNRCYLYQRSQNCSATQNLDVYYKKRICEQI